jgi:hypothetical protein
VVDAEHREPNVRGFWTWFAESHLEILEIMGGRRPGRVTEMIDAALASNDLSLTYEVTEGLFGGELTFTPEGDPALGKFIDRFVASAPSFDTWVIFSRIQRKSLATALAFTKALHGVDLKNAHLRIVESDDLFNVTFLDDALVALDEDKRYAVAGTFLDHALGEELTMSYLGEIEFQRSGPGVAMSLAINELIRETAGSETADLETKSSAEQTA